MARIEIVTGANALSASLAAGTGLIQLEQVGGFQTFNSSSYNIGHTSIEVLRPDADVTTTNWGPLTLFSRLNERSADGAITEITSSAISSILPATSSRLFEVGVTNPSLSREVLSATVNFTAAKSGTFSAGTGSVGDNTANVSLSLKEGSTVRALEIFTDISEDFTLLSFDLTEEEISSVGDWSNVSVLGDFDLGVTTGSSTVNARATQIEVQVKVSSEIKAPPVDNLVYRLTWGT